LRGGQSRRFRPVLYGFEIYRRFDLATLHKYLGLGIGYDDPGRLSGYAA
jgi:hypothetical protein